MPKLSKTLIVPHDPTNLYELVRDIRSYPNFIKWIQKLSVHNERSENALYKCTGTALVGFKGFVETFSTDVIGDPEKCQIDVSLARGPFRHLRNQWRFEPAETGGANIHFFIDYEFRNPILRLLAKNNTDLAVDRIMAAFTSEADRRYAKL
ncbi:MAG: type II toxin-antitoxin system RatA family toxin [Pseudomonadota bacterium]